MRRPAAANSSSPPRYRLLRELGEGGTAQVFLAVAYGPEGFEKLVVLKRLKPKLANDLELRQSFLQEARLSVRLNHPNVVQVNEVIEHEGMPALVMEFLEGRPLSEVILRAGGELTLPMTLRILSDALVGLHYSHELCDFDGTPLHVVHRDMTPQNVFVTFDGVVKVLDFGIARAGVGQDDTGRGVVKGKLRYMPPEQLIGERVDRRADVYATGVMLWEAGARERLWKDLPDAAIMNRVISGEIPSPRSVNSVCPVELERICQRALAKARSDRYATAAELRADVDALAARLTPRVRNADIGQRMAVWFADFRSETRQAIERALAEDTSLSLTGQQSVSLPAPAPDGPRRGRRALSARVYAALAGTAVIAVGLGLFGREARTPTPAPPVAPPRAATAPSPRVTLRITAFPAHAVIRVDGVRAPSNPFSEEMAVDHEWHEIVAEAPGFQTVSRRARITQDTDLVLSLEPLPVPSASATPPHPQAPRRALVAEAPPPAASARPSAAPARSADCASPYYLDARGVKKFRVECL